MLYSCRECGVRGMYDMAAYVLFWRRLNSDKKKDILIQVEKFRYLDSLIGECRQSFIILL